MRINLNGRNLEDFEELPINEKIKPNKDENVDPELIKRMKKENKPKRGIEEK